MNLKKLLALTPALFLIETVQAHCPLCTAGAVVAAGGAAWLGVSNIVIGIFIGAFAVSIGWWISRLIKKKYIPFQRTSIIILSFLTTIIPLLPLMKSPYPFYISLIGDYGSLLNRTYLINLFLLGSLIGGFIVCLTPYLSKKISALRNKKIFPYQGIILTFILLIIISIILEVLI